MISLKIKVLPDRLLGKRILMRRGCQYGNSFFVPSLGLFNLFSKPEGHWIKSSHIFLWRLQAAHDKLQHIIYRELYELGAILARIV